MLGYIRQYKPILDLLEKHVIKQNPFQLENHKYSAYSITKALVKAALTMNRSIRDIERVFPNGPTARTILNRIYSKKPEEILEAFNGYIKEKYGRKVRDLTRRRKIVFVNIDAHLEPYWGKKATWIIHCKQRNSTNRFMALETFSIQLKDFKITLKARAYKWVKWKQGLEQKTRWANGYADTVLEIKRDFMVEDARICVVMDGRYFDTLLLRTLDDKGIFFITRASMAAPNIKRIASRLNFNELIPDELNVFEYHGYEMVCSHTWPKIRFPLRLIFVRRGGEVVALVTNLPKFFTARFVVEVFRRRFWIENSYRDGRQMRIRTCSRCLSVRYVFFLIGLLLLNFLVLLSNSFDWGAVLLRTVSLILFILIFLEEASLG